MTKLDTISVIIPTFNRASLIERAIHSLFKQTRTQWEAIIVDDGSTDNTKEIVQQYLADRRVRYFRQGNAGVGVARNFGVKKTAADFVTFLDSDDEFLPDAIETMQDDIAFLKDDIFILLYGRIRVTKTSSYQEPLPDGTLVDYKSAIRGSWPKIDTVALCRKEIFDIARFPEFSLPISDPGVPKHVPEALFWLRVLRSGTRAMLKSKKFYLYHVESSDRLTGGLQHRKRAKTMPQHIIAFLAEFGADYEALNPDRLAHFHLEKAIYEIADGHAAAGRQSLRCARKYGALIWPLANVLYLSSFVPNRLFVSAAAWFVDRGF